MTTKNKQAHKELSSLLILTKYVFVGTISIMLTAFILALETDFGKLDLSTTPSEDPFGRPSARMSIFLEENEGIFESTPYKYDEPVLNGMMISQVLRASSTLGLDVDLQEISQRELEYFNRSIKQLERELRVLNQLILKSDVEDVLTVGRMREELDARKQFEKEQKELIQNRFAAFQDILDASEKSFDTNLKRIETIEQKVTQLQYWIWGVLVTFFGGLIAVILTLLKKLTKIIAIGNQ